jgi:molybdopterin converting factor subunit 1
MAVTVLFFAAARELTGVGRAVLDLAPTATVGAVRNELASRWPRLAPLLGRCALAVNERFAEDEEQLPAGAVVAVVPPVSGG